MKKKMKTVTVETTIIMQAVVQAAGEVVMLVTSCLVVQLREHKATPPVAG